MKPLFILAVLGCAVIPAWAGPLDEMRALVEQGRDAEAYALGERHPELLGDPGFDYLFGVAALNRGSASEGLLAMERVLMRHGGNRRARFQLARAYAMLGEDARARIEFEALADGARGEEAERIAQFLESIRAREARYKPVWSGFVELGAGHDTNVNSGVLAGPIAGLPEGYVVSTGQAAEKLAASVAQAVVGVQGSYPVAPGVAVYGGAGLSGRRHAGSAASAFDASQAGAQGGIAVISGRQTLRFGTEFSNLWIDRQKYLSLGTVLADWQWQANPFDRLGAALQWSRLNYRDTLVYADLGRTSPINSGADARDSHLTQLSASWTRSFLHPWSPALTLGVQLGQERNRSERPDLSRRLGGLRVAVLAQPAPKWTVNAALGVQGSRFDEVFTTGSEARRDTLRVLDIGVAYALTPKLSVRGEYQRFDQRSNIGLYAFTRDLLFIKLRYDLP